MKWVTVPLLTVVAMALAVQAGAQTRTWGFGVLVESPELVVPVATLDTGDDSGREGHISLMGLTLQGSLARRTHERRRRFVSLAVTPRNADYSNHIYQNGRLDVAAAYRSASFRIGAGIERQRRNGSTGRYAVVADYRLVRDLGPDAAARWRRPFVGLEISERWRRVTATESFGTRIDGVDLRLTGRVFAGNRTWSQVEADAHAGRRLGPVFGQVDVGGFTGHGLDTVNAFLIGGSWHLGDARLASGYRAGEYRFEHAATASGRASLRVSGPLEIGARVSAATSGAIRRTGAGVEARTVYSGVVVDVGVAWAIGPASSDQRRPVFYGQVTTAILQR